MNQWLEKRPAFCRVRDLLLLSHTTRRRGRRRPSWRTNTHIKFHTKIWLTQMLNRQPANLGEFKVVTSDRDGYLLNGKSNFSLIFLTETTLLFLSWMNVAQSLKGFSPLTVQTRGESAGYNNKTELCSQYFFQSGSSRRGMWFQPPSSFSTGTNTGTHTDCRPDAETDTLQSAEDRNRTCLYCIFKHTEQWQGEQLTVKCIIQEISMITQSWELWKDESRIEWDRSFILTTS